MNTWIYEYIMENHHAVFLLHEYIRENLYASPAIIQILVIRWHITLQNLVIYGLGKGSIPTQQHAITRTNGIGTA